MDDVIELAKRLAHLLANHERTIAFRTAASAVEADPEASRVQREYAEAVETVREREVAGRPIEPEQKRALLAATDGVRKSPKLISMLEAHAAFSEMMEAVQTILSGLGSPDGEAGAHDHDHGHGHEHGHEHGHGHEHKPDPEPPSKSVLWTP